MKLVMDERFKHRLVGVLVITSIAVLFAPIILKRPQQSAELNRRVVIKLPPKPSMPEVTIPQAQSLFKTTQVALPSQPKIEDKVPLESQIAKAEPLKTESSHAPMAVKSLVLSANHGVQKGGKQVKALPKPNRAEQILSGSIPKKPDPKVQAANRYSVQLAVFSQQNNAVNLVKVLKTKGFKAFFRPDKLSNKSVFRVLVGNTQEKQAAKVLQQQLASAVQIKGFIVPSTRTS